MEANTQRIQIAKTEHRSPTRRTGTLPSGLLGSTMTGEEPNSPRNYAIEAAVLDSLPAKVQSLQEEIGKVVVGQEENVNAALYALFSRGHCLLVTSHEASEYSHTHVTSPERVRNPERRCWPDSLVSKRFPSFFECHSNIQSNYL